MAENVKHNLKREYVSINKVVPNPNNTKIHPESQIAELVDSINKFGFTKPLLVDESYMILAGHGSHIAAGKAGLEKIPVIVMSHLSKREQRALALADNKLSELSSWDHSNLAGELNYLLKEDYDISSLGWDEQELDEIFKIDFDNGVIPEKEVSTVKSHQRSKTKNTKPKKSEVVLKLKYEEADYQKVIVFLNSLKKDSVEAALLSLCE